MRGDGGPRRRMLGRRSLTAVLVGLLFVNLAMVSLWSWRTFASSQGFADVTTDMLKEPAVREVVAEQIVGALEQQETTARVAVAARPVVEVVVADLVATDALPGRVPRRRPRAALGDRRGSAQPADGQRRRRRRRSCARASRPANPELADGAPRRCARASSSASPRARRSTRRCGSRRSPDGWRSRSPLGAVGLLRRGRAPRAPTGGGRSRRSASASSSPAWPTSPCCRSASTSPPASATTDRERTALRAVFWSVTHLINVQAKVVITIGTVLAIAAAYAGTGADPLPARHAPRRGRLGGCSSPAWRAVACLAAIAVGFFAMRWPEATTSIVIRIVAFLGFVAGAIGLLDVLGSVDWAHDGAGHVQRTARRLAIGVTGAISVVSVTMLFGGLAFARALRAPNADHAGDQRDRLQRAPRALRPPPRRGRPRRHPQLDGGERGGLLPFGRQRRHRRPAGERRAGVPRRPALRRAAAMPSCAPTSAARPSEELAQAELDGRESGRDRGRRRPTSDRRPTTERRSTCATSTASSAPRRPSTRSASSTTSCARTPTRSSCSCSRTSSTRRTPSRSLRAQWAGGARPRSWRRASRCRRSREMIERGRQRARARRERGRGRAVVHPGLTTLLQETPYTFAEPRRLLVRPRTVARRTNPLFLVNHWLDVDPPSRAVAADVNARDVLLDRVEECEAERGRRPNILAVDFYAHGDLLDVVDELNGAADASLGGPAGLRRGARCSVKKSRMISARIRRCTRRARPRQLVALAGEAVERHVLAEQAEGDEQLLGLADRAAEVVLGVEQQHRHVDVVRRTGSATSRRTASGSSRWFAPCSLRKAVAMSLDHSSEIRLLTARSLQMAAEAVAEPAGELRRHVPAVAAAEHADAVGVAEPVARPARRRARPSRRRRRPCPSPGPARSGGPDP